MIYHTTVQLESLNRYITCITLSFCQQNDNVMSCITATIPKRKLNPMPKKQSKDFLERLINHTMRHGRKSAAIKLLAKSLSLFGQQVIRQGGISHRAHLRRVGERPHLSATLENWVVANQQFPFAFDVNINQPYTVKTLAYTKKENKDIAREGRPTHTFSLVNSSPLAVGDCGSREATSSFCKQNEKAMCGLVEMTSCNTTTLCSYLSSSSLTRVTSLTSCNQPPFARKKTSLMKVQQVLKVENKLLDKTRATGENQRRSIKEFVKNAISHIKPSLETRKKKIAGITRHIPSVVSPSRGEGLAIRWLLAAARERHRKGGKGIAKCLSDELLDAYFKRGEARQKRDSLHKLAESNRSYIRYRWW